MVAPVPSIVAMGGGGFSDEPDNPLLDDYVLSLTGRSRPRVCFLPTAASDSLPYVARFFDALAAGLPGGWGCDDGAAVVFEGDALREVVSSRPGASAYRVDLVDGQVSEVAVPGRFLGAL